MKYLVYNNPEGKQVDFVRDTDGSPRVYESLELAEDCASNQDNGYVVPFGLDIIDLAHTMDSCRESLHWSLQDACDEILQQ